MFIYNTSNGRFAVDREFKYMELVSRRGLGELFGPPGELFGPRGGVRTSDQFLWKYVFQFLGKSGPENQNVELFFFKKTWFQLLGKLGPDNQTYMKIGVTFPPKSGETIVFISSNDAPVTRSLICVCCVWWLRSGNGPILGAPTLGSTRAGGHDDGS